MKKLLTAICLLFLALGVITSSCSDRHSSFSRFENLPDNGWRYGDTVKIVPSRLDSATMRTLEVAIRHSNDYPYRNLWLEVSYTTRHFTIRDTIELELADVYGRWLGKGFGPSYQVSRPLGARFALPDSTPIYIRHIMRVDTLPGIEQIGITINSASARQQ